MCGSCGQKIVEFIGEDGVNSILNQYHRDPMLTFQGLSVRDASEMVSSYT